MRYLLLLMISSILTLNAAEAIGRISALNGQADLLRGTETLPLHMGDRLHKGDRIRTHERTKLQIIFKDHTVISLGQKSLFRIDDYLYDPRAPKADFSITRGIFKSITGKIGKIAPRRFHLHTKNATIGIRGTTVLGNISKDHELIACSYGRIVVTTAKSEIGLVKGQKTIIAQNLIPSPARPMNHNEIHTFDLAVEPLPQTENSSTTKTTPDSGNSVSKATQPSLSTTPTQNQDWGPWNKASNTAPLEQAHETIVQKKNGFKEMIARAGSTNPSYDGTLLGSVTNSIDPTEMAIRQDATNGIHLDVDLAHATLSGEMHFTTEIGQRWQTRIGGSVAQDGQFRFQSDRYSGGGEGDLEGAHLDMAKGSFRLVNDRQHGGITHTATGRFSAKRSGK